MIARAMPPAAQIHGWNHHLELVNIHQTPSSGEIGVKNWIGAAVAVTLSLSAAPASAARYLVTWEGTASIGSDYCHFISCTELPPMAPNSAFKAQFTIDDNGSWEPDGSGYYTAGISNFKVSVGSLVYDEFDLTGGEFYFTQSDGDMNVFLSTYGDVHTPFANTWVSTFFHMNPLSLPNTSAPPHSLEFSVPITSAEGAEFYVDVDYYAAKLTRLTISAVPEPATWAMMILGFGGVGAMLRADRRRRAPALSA